MTAPKKPRRLQYATYFRRAAAILERDGWTQKIMENADGAVCAVGAFNKAVTGHPLDYPNFEWRNWFWKAAPRKRLAYMGGRPSLTLWNDQVAKDKSEVIAAFHRAAKLAGKRLAPAVTK